MSYRYLRYPEDNHPVEAIAARGNRNRYSFAGSEARQAPDAVRNDNLTLGIVEYFLKHFPNFGNYSKDIDFHYSREKLDHQQNVEGERFSWFGTEIAIR